MDTQQTIEDFLIKNELEISVSIAVPLLGELLARQPEPSEAEKEKVAIDVSNQGDLINRIYLDEGFNKSSLALFYGSESPDQLQGIFLEYYRLCQDVKTRMITAVEQTATSPDNYTAMEGLWKQAFTDSVDAMGSLDKLVSMYGAKKDFMCATSNETEAGKLAGKIIDNVKKLLMPSELIAFAHNLLANSMDAGKGDEQAQTKFESYYTVFRSYLDLTLQKDTKFDDKLIPEVMFQFMVRACPLVNEFSIMHIDKELAHYKHVYETVKAEHR